MEGLPGSKFYFLTIRELDKLIRLGQIPALMPG